MLVSATTSTMIRSGVVRIQPILLRSPTSCPYSTLTSSPLGLRPKCLVEPSPPKPLGRRSSAPLITKRKASTAANQDAAAAAAASASQAAANPDLPPLDWNQFFQLRKTRRRWQLGFSVFTCISGGSAGAIVLSLGVAEPVINQIPLDPFVTLGLMTFGCAALGWLAGPILGNSVFYSMNRKYKKQMTLVSFSLPIAGDWDGYGFIGVPLTRLLSTSIQKESQFFARIKKNRVDPSSSSTGNPVPDFYGEKIQSVAGYRQWLKDQRAFNKKRTTFV